MVGSAVELTARRVRKPTLPPSSGIDREGGWALQNVSHHTTTANTTYYNSVYVSPYYVFPYNNNTPSIDLL